MITIPGLSESLRPMLEYEIARGNWVERVDRPAGTNCPLAVIFGIPLDIPGFIGSLGLPVDVTTWENHDRHYPLEKGYLCVKSRHALAGPLRA